MPVLAHDELLQRQAAVSAVVVLGLTALWGLTGGGVFWPGWVAFGLLLLMALVVSLRWAWAQTPGLTRRLAVQGAVSAVLVVMEIGLWAGTGFGPLWPYWSALGYSVALAAHWLIAVLWFQMHPEREQKLNRRVEELTRTRRGALDVEAAELRRIERDLHDGAQARLVALSMQLGRAEERLGDQPEVAAEFRRARDEASAVIGELRDLARGIAPPVLADRGLPAAVEALGRRAPIPVTVTAQLAGRPAPVIETAAYFVVAEALTNAVKHGGGAPAHVTVSQLGDRLTAAVRDEGPGGAQVDLGGGLEGLRARVEALDGTLVVSSAAGAGTTVTAELPCA
ncbi:MAG TPA: histidine kinase [Thermoleophilaceae bacterium]|nr:histidine kinase [Thermoleophilaceae bacterium]